MTIARVMKGPSRSPSRLYVILAREAHVAVIFRCGPAKWTQIIKWNTDVDTFEAGQWFHGRIFDEVSDLSPDGTKLIYGVVKYSGKPYKEPVGASWTAVSRPPFLTALALWRRFGRWDGGGLFLTNDHIWLNGFRFSGSGPQVDLEKGEVPAGMKITGNNNTPDEDRPLYFRRIESSGWKQIQAGRHSQFSRPSIEVETPKLSFSRPIAIAKSGDKSIRSTTPIPECATYERETRQSSNVLVQKIGNPGFTIPTYAIRKIDGTTVPINGVTWADWDHEGRLAYAREGKLFVAVPDGDIDRDSIELADFNANTFTDIEAPDWATKW